VLVGDQRPRSGARSGIANGQSSTRPMTGRLWDEQDHQRVAGARNPTGVLRTFPL